MRDRFTGATAGLALVVLLALAGCNLGAAFDPTPGVWALNESSNNYLVRTWTAGSGEDVSQTWALPAGAAGFVVSGRNMDIEVLDTSTCSLVASRAVSRNILVSVDERGRVDFFAQPDAPAMDVELDTSTACAAATPPPPGVTS